MKAVKTHKYAMKGGVTLYHSMRGDILAELPGGTWLGVVEEHEDWYHVITAQLDGWVQKDAVIDARPFTLSAILSGQVAGLVQNYILL